MRSDCEECARLWREYAEATTKHIQLDSKLRLAALERDADRIEILTPEVEAAEERRITFREAISTHDRAAHPKAAAVE